MFNKQSSGFTLLEVVVALAIAALAMVVLVRAAGDGLFAADTASRTEEAVERAQSHLDAVGSSVALLQGETEGDDGDGFHWHLRVEPAERYQIKAAAGENAVATTLYSVEVSVTWPGMHGRDRAVTLKTYRTGRGPTTR